MNEILRPLNLGEILDRTFQLYRNNFWLFAGTAALPLVVSLILVIPIAIFSVAAPFAIPLFAGGPTDSAKMIGGGVFILAFLIFVSLYVAIYVFSIAGITQTTVAVQRGEKLTIRAALKSVLPRFWTYFWYLFLQGIMAVVVPMCVAVVVIGPLMYLLPRGGVGIAGGIAVVLLLFLLELAVFVVIVWLALSYSMGMAACVVEKKTAWQSLMRSWSLSKGTRGRIFVLILLLVALSFVVMMISYLLAAIVIAATAFLGTGKAVAVIGVIVAGIVYVVGIFGTQIALVPVPWIALVLFYYDQRVRTEGYDIEWMMQQAGLTQPPSAPPPGDGTGGGSAAFGPVTPPDTVEADNVGGR
jgi:hypothetical protein